MPRIDLRTLLSPLKRTPFHPQWLILRHEAQQLEEIAGQLDGLVLDIGCANQRLKPLLNPGCECLGLDYLTIATERYGSYPDVFGDGQALPIATGSVDSVALLDVLEHLPNPEDCIAEIARVLRPAGTLVLQVPFLYPLHDAPFDFRRWTRFGLRHLLGQYGFAIIAERHFGPPAETAALLGAIALARLGQTNLQRPWVSLAMLPLIGLLIPLVNLTGWILGRIFPNDDLMPMGYRLICTKST